MASTKSTTKKVAKKPASKRAAIKSIKSKQDVKSKKVGHRTIGVGPGH